MYQSMYNKLSRTRERIIKRIGSYSNGDEDLFFENINNLVDIYQDKANKTFTFNQLHDLEDSFYQEVRKFYLQYLSDTIDYKELNLNINDFGITGKEHPVDFIAYVNSLIENKKVL